MISICFLNALLASGLHTHQTLGLWSLVKKISTSEPLFLLGTESVEVYGGLLELSLDFKTETGSCLHCVHLIHLNNPLIFFLSVFSLIHTCGVCLKCKQSPQRFTQQHVPTPLWGAHLQLMAWTDPGSVHSITLPLPPYLTPGDDGSERRTFKTNSSPDNSTPVQWGLGEQKHKDTTHNETHTKQVQYCMEGLQPNRVRFSLAPKKAKETKTGMFSLFSQLLVWFSAKLEHEKSNSIS